MIKRRVFLAPAAFGALAVGLLCTLPSTAASAPPQKDDAQATATGTKEAATRRERVLRLRTQKLHFRGR